MIIDTLYTYPIKSTKPIFHQTIKVASYGLFQDRSWALFDENFNVITARDFPQLLQISAEIKGEQMIILYNGTQVEQTSWRSHGHCEKVTIFKEMAKGYVMQDSINAFFSDYLGVQVKLMHMGKDFARPVSPKYGGKPNDVLNYADECPILLISEPSLQDLNSRLEEQITMLRFRPNITIRGCNAYEEETWQNIRIGNCEFEVAQQCKRCVFTTIDPISLEKSSVQEPLRTLAKYKKHPRGGVAFGVHLIPTKTGEIKLGDEIEIIE